MVQRHRALGTPGKQLALWLASQPSIEQIAAKAALFGADLVIVDTLTRVARVKDENDNAAWIRWFNRNDRYVRASAAAWLFIHHNRKSPGPDGTAIRGASAIFGCVDIAFSLDRTESGKNRRVLKSDGSRFEESDELIIELTNGSYQRVGDLETVSILEHERLSWVREVLADEPATVSQLENRLRQKGRSVTETTLRRYLDRLVGAGLAIPSGSGGPGDPYKYSSSTTQNSGSGGSEKASEVVDAPQDTYSTTLPNPLAGSDLHRSTPLGVEERSANQAPFYQESGNSPPPPASRLSPSGSADAGEEAADA